MHIAQELARTERTDYPWQVCLEDDNGGILGAGIMLDGEYIVTCAHVVDPGPEAGESLVRVRFDNREIASPGQARIIPDCFCPADESERGDVALLRLRDPLPGQPRTLLRGTWRRGQQVRVLGYPRGVPHGLWAAARIVGPAARPTQLVQLDVLPESPPIEPGFSGAAVIDDGTGDIVGMIRRCETGGGGACWMLPVKTIAAILGPVGRYLAAPSSDPEFSGPEPSGPKAGDPTAGDPGVAAP
ncbi:MAG: S1 family peptidase, partial [Trebonia sp.]